MFEYDILNNNDIERYLISLKGNTELLDIKEVIEALGGIKSTSEILKIPYRTVQNWKLGVNSPQKWVAILIAQNLYLTIENYYLDSNNNNLLDRKNEIENTVINLKDKISNLIDEELNNYFA